MVSAAKSRPNVHAVMPSPIIIGKARAQSVINMRLKRTELGMPKPRPIA
jgi:hypothetical protein